MAIKIYSHNNGDSSQLLAEALNARLLRHRGSRYVYRNGDTIINWGHTGSLPYPRNSILNKPDLIPFVSNKRKFFEVYTANGGGDFNVPPYFFTQAAARQWLEEGRGRTIVARTVLAGHEGIGIVMCNLGDPIPEARLYTGYVKKKAEYRIHVMGGRVIDEVQKKRRLDRDNAGDSRIRNTANGYVFARTDVVVPATVRENAIKAVDYYLLDFGAVDVVYNEHENKAYVLEINTAPGIEGTTVERYADGFRNLIL